MPDVSLITTIITTAGTLGGALGGIALTNWTGIRREERQAQRQREEKRADERQLAYSELLSANAQLRAHAEITCQHHWTDLNVRLAAAHDYAVAVGLQAARSALLSPQEVANAALALGHAAGSLARWMTQNAKMGKEYSGPDGHFLPGEVDGRPDFTELDTCSRAFLRLAAKALGISLDESLSLAAGVSPAGISQRTDSAVAATGQAITGQSAN